MTEVPNWLLTVLVFLSLFGVTAAVFFVVGLFNRAVEFRVRYRTRNLREEIEETRALYDNQREMVSIITAENERLKRNVAELGGKPYRTDVRVIGGIASKPTTRGGDE